MLDISGQNVTQLRRRKTPSNRRRDERRKLSFIAKKKQQSFELSVNEVSTHPVETILTEQKDEIDQEATGNDVNLEKRRK